MQQGDRPDGNEMQRVKQGGRKEGREGVAPLLNLGDPHLAGGEQNNQFFLSF